MGWACETQQLITPKLIVWTIVLLKSMSGVVINVFSVTPMHQTRDFMFPLSHTTIKTIDGPLRLQPMNLEEKYDTLIRVKVDILDFSSSLLPSFLTYTPPFFA